MINERFKRIASEIVECFYLQFPKEFEHLENESFKLCFEIYNKEICEERKKLINKHLEISIEISRMLRQSFVNKSEGGEKMFGFKKKIVPHVVGRRTHPVARLLENNPGYAMTVEAIAYETKMNENTIRSMLRRLMDDGYVEHKKPFFHWK